MAYQIAFDLEDMATQEFLQKILKSLPETKPADNSMDVDGEKNQDTVRNCFEGMGCSFSYFKSRMIPFLESYEIFSLGS
jgi:hypothetical protein